MVQPYGPTLHLRRTRVRQAILALLTQKQSHLGAPEIVLALQQHGTKVNKTSVYRELATLERSGLVQPVHFDDGMTRYELTQEQHHHHAVCVSCKTVFDLPLNTEMKKLEDRVTAKAGFHVLRHQLEFFGHCARCEQRRKV